MKILDPHRIELLKMRVEILKLKANDYEWSCYVPQDVKDELNKTLEEINEALNESISPKT